MAPGRSQRRLREGRESVGAAAHVVLRVQLTRFTDGRPNGIVCMVARRAATGSARNRLSPSEAWYRVEGFKVKTLDGTFMPCSQPQSQPHRKSRVFFWSCTHADVPSAGALRSSRTETLFGGAGRKNAEKNHDTYQAPGRNLQHPRAGRMWDNRVIAASWRYPAV